MVSIVRWVRRRIGSVKMRRFVWPVAGIGGSKPASQRAEFPPWYGSLFAALVISASSIWNSFKPDKGMMMLALNRPPSSTIRKNRPRGFSLSRKLKLLRSHNIRSHFKVSSWMYGRGDEGCPGCLAGRVLNGEGRSFEIIALADIR